jgi:hypothetical protein
MNENNLNIKLGDMIQSDTGACGIVVVVPNTENPAINSQYVMNWNRGEVKEWGTDPRTMKHLIDFGKWKVVPL